MVVTLILIMFQECIEITCFSDKKTIDGGGSCIDSPQWCENKKATVNPYNYDSNCFQYAIRVATINQLEEIH